MLLPMAFFHSFYGWVVFHLEEGMATHSSILAWRIPWTEEPGGLRKSWAWLKWLSTRECSIPLCVCQIVFIFSSGNGHLGWSHVLLVIVCSAVIALALKWSSFSLKSCSVAHVSLWAGLPVHSLTSGWVFSAFQLEVVLLEALVVNEAKAKPALAWGSSTKEDER